MTRPKLTTNLAHNLHKTATQKWPHTGHYRGN